MCINRFSLSFLLCWTLSLGSMFVLSLPFSETTIDKKLVFSTVTQKILSSNCQSISIYNGRSWNISSKPKIYGKLTDGQEAEGHNTPMLILLKRKERTKYSQQPLKSCCVNICKFELSLFPSSHWKKFQMQYGSSIDVSNFMKNCDIILGSDENVDAGAEVKSIKRSRRKRNAVLRYKRGQGTTELKNKTIKVGGKKVLKMMPRKNDEGHYVTVHYNTHSTVGSTLSQPPMSLNVTELSEIERIMSLRNSKDPYWAFLCVVSLVVLVLFTVFWTRLCQKARTDLQYIDYQEGIHHTTVHNVILRKARFLDVFKQWKKRKRRGLRIQKESVDNREHLLNGSLHIDDGMFYS